MNWEYPFSLWLLPAVFVLVICAFIAGRGSLKSLHAIGKDSIEWQVRMFLRDFSMAASLILAVLALADPRSGLKPVNGERSGLDIAVAFDVSRSMLARDLSPNRLERASAALGQISRAFEDSRFSLIPFKGSAIPILPMTEDRVILDLWIERLGPGLSTSHGTDIEQALTSALATFPSGVGRNKIMVIFSDGEALSGRIGNISRRISEQGIAVHSIISGTSEGGPIPLGNGSNLMDEGGQPVISRAQPDLLRQIAEDSGGSIYDLSRPDAIADFIETVENDREFIESRGIRFLETQRFRIFLIPALAMLFFHFLARILPWSKHS